MIKVTKGVVVCTVAPFCGMMVLVENLKLTCMRDVSVVGQYRHLGIRSEKIFSIPNLSQLLNIKNNQVEENSKTKNLSNILLTMGISSYVK